MKLIVFTALLFFNFSALNSTRLKWVYNTVEDFSQSGTKNTNKKRLVWTKELEILFQKAINNLSPEQQTAANILQKMKNIDNKNVINVLTREKVNSHLQKYRIKKDKEISKADINFLLN